MTAKGSFTCTVFRGYNLPRYLYMLATHYNLDIHIESSGIIMVDYFVTLKGSKENMQKFMDEMETTFERINNDLLLDN